MRPVPSCGLGPTPHKQDDPGPFGTLPPTRQAGGHWFEPSTAHFFGSPPALRARRGIARIGPPPVSAGRFRHASPSCRYGTPTGVRALLSCVFALEGQINDPEARSRIERRLVELSA